MRRSHLYRIIVILVILITVSLVMLVFRWKWAVVADPRCGPVPDNRTPNYLYIYVLLSAVVCCVYMVVIFGCMLFRYSRMCYEV
jgi:hypothetical protein